jgi:hypothetical protein
MHAVDEVHETLRRPPEPLEGGKTSVLCIDQLVPLQLSASGRMSPPIASPTATHADGEVHETPLRAVASETVAFGVLWVAHRRPSHWSAIVCA